MLKNKLIELRESILHEASLVEKMIEISIQGLLENNKQKLDDAMEYEEIINNLEMDIEEKCIMLIALYQPEAKDLRTIITILKMNSDLERMGDMAVNIIGSSYFIIERPPLKKLIDLPNMAKETIKMLKNALQSFTNEDVPLAREVCKFDDVIDAYKDQITRELITYMIADTQNIERAIQLTRITQNLERIADLCTNIAEDTVFMTQGKVIKHNIENQPIK